MPTPCAMCFQPKQLRFFLHNWVSRLASTFTIFGQPFWVINGVCGCNPSVTMHLHHLASFASYTQVSTHTLPLPIPFIYSYLLSSLLPKCHRGDMRVGGLSKSPTRNMEAGRSSMKYLKKEVILQFWLWENDLGISYPDICQWTWKAFKEALHLQRDIKTMYVSYN